MGRKGPAELSKIEINLLTIAARLYAGLTERADHPQIHSLRFYWVDKVRDELVCPTIPFTITVHSFPWM
jgi:hypothetical protein